MTLYRRELVDLKSGDGILLIEILNDTYNPGTDEKLFSEEELEKIRSCEDARRAQSLL